MFIERNLNINAMDGKRIHGGDYYVEFTEGLEREMTSPSYFTYFAACFINLCFSSQRWLQLDAKKNIIVFKAMILFRRWRIVAVLSIFAFGLLRLLSELSPTDNLLAVANCKSCRRRLLLLHTLSIPKGKGKQSPLPRGNISSAPPPLPFFFK